MKQVGTIKKIWADRGYAFIFCQSENRDYFLHSSNFQGDWKALGEGQYVEFDANVTSGKSQAENANFANGQPVAEKKDQPVADNKSSRIVGDYAGRTLNLSDEKRLQTLREISRWKLEAKLDDIKRYFFSVPELNDVVAGEASFVIVPKGNGENGFSSIHLGAV